MINTSPLPLGCAKQQCQSFIRAARPTTGNGNGKRARGSRPRGEGFAGGSFWWLLQCHVLKEILRGTIGAQPAQDTWAAHRAPSCSALSLPPVWVERSHRNRQAYMQAEDMFLHPPMPANKTQGMLNLPQLKQSQPTNLKGEQIPLIEATRLPQPRVRRAPVGQPPCWPLCPHLSCGSRLGSPEQGWQQVIPGLAEQQGRALLPGNNS